MVIFRQAITTGVEPEELSRKERERKRERYNIACGIRVCAKAKMKELWSESENDISSKGR